MRYDIHQAGTLARLEALRAGAARERLWRSAVRERNREAHRRRWWHVLLNRFRRPVKAPTDLHA